MHILYVESLAAVLDYFSLNLFLNNQFPQNLEISKVFINMIQH